jgi:zinc protease
MTLRGETKALSRTGAPLWGRIALVAVLVAGCAPLPPSREIKLPVQQFAVGRIELPSGLQILVEDDPSARAVTSVLVVGAGGADDPVGQEGLAHLVEHLNFRSHAEGQPSLTARLALYGIGSWNAETSMDTTTFYQLGAPETLGRMIETDVARMVGPLQGVTSEQFVTERGVVLNELRWSDESGHHQEIGRTLFHQLFPEKHPYARGFGGTPESVGQLTLEQARAWTATHYRPRAMTWVLAGALDPIQTTAVLEQLLPQSLREGDPAGPPATHQDVALSARVPRLPLIPTVVAPVEHQEIVVAWSLPPSQGKFEPALMTLPGLVEDHATQIDGVESASAQVITFENAALLELDIQTKDGVDPVKLVEKLRDSWTDTWTIKSRWGALLAEAFFARARTATLVALAQANESLVSRTLNRAHRTRSSRSAQTLTAQGEAIAAVSFADVMATGREYITGERLAVVFLKPAAGGGRGDDVQRPAEVPTAFSPESVRAEYPPEAVTKFIRGPGLSKATSFHATNGLEVVLVPGGRTGLVTVTLGVPGGRRTSSPEGMADRLRWSQQSWEYGFPNSLGASVRQWWTDDAGYLRYRGSAGNLPNLLAMLSERILTRRVKDPPKAELVRTSTEPELQAFDRRFWHALQGEGSWISSPSAAEVAVLKADAAQSWLEQVLDPRRAVLVVAGDVPASVPDEVEHWLSRWRGPEKAGGSTLPPLPSGPGTLRVVKTALPRAKQVRVRLACTATGRTLEDELAFRLVASEITRQWNVLERGTLGSTYGFTSSTALNRDGTMRLVVSGRVENTGIRRMAVAVAQAWKGLPEAAATPSKLNRLRWEFAREFNVSFLTSAAVADAVAEERLRGRPATSLDDVPRALMQLGPEQIAEVGGQCQRSAVLGLLGEPSVLDVDALLPSGKQIVSR